MIIMKYVFNASVEEERFQKDGMIERFFEKRLGKEAGSGSGCFVGEKELVCDGELLYEKKYEEVQAAAKEAREKMKFVRIHVMKMIKDEEGDWIVE